MKRYRIDASDDPGAEATTLDDAMARARSIMARRAPHRGAYVRITESVDWKPFRKVRSWYAAGQHPYWRWEARS